MRAALLLTLTLLGACGSSEPEPEPGAFEPLSPREQLLRLSIDLRGIHPSETDLSAIEENPELYEAYVDRWLEDPRVVDRVTELFEVRWLTRTGVPYFSSRDHGLNDVPNWLLAETAAREPLELLRYVLQQDLAWDHLVTADHTMADPLLARMWGIDREDPEAPGWVRGRYRDGRPHAGMLSMTTIWQRYPSMGGNANRHRANAISRMFLCDDFLARPIVLNRAAVDLLQVDPENAIATTPSCQSCHSTLDPLAANLFGFFHEDADAIGVDAIVYRPENEGAWREHAGKPPGFYGRPIAHLRELGESLAEDPRFAACAVRTVVEGLSQRDLVDEDWSELQYHLEVFEEGGRRILPVVRSVVTSEAYRAARAYDPELDARIAGARVLSPSQLASVVEDLTGYRWTLGGVDLMTAPQSGLPVLTGGLDGLAVTRRSYLPSVGTALAIERLAQGAGWHVARRDLDPERDGSVRLLRHVTREDTPETAPEAFEAQIRHLYLAITGIPLPEEATEPVALVELWKSLYAVQASPVAAWAGVISAVLRDPRLLFY